MSTITDVAIVLSSLVSAFLFIDFHISYYMKPPKFNDTWWGPGIQNSSEVDTAITPFQINVSDEILYDLQLRLERTRPFTPPLEGEGNKYGINTKSLEIVLDYWKNYYEWRKQEEFLNTYPQFKTNIQGLQIHFIHVKPPAQKKVRVPLLMLHCWGGSIREFYDIIPLLTTTRRRNTFVFELIIPSLPGFIFSDAPTKSGFDTPQMAVVMNNLMKRLGFEKYYIHGSDWGGILVSTMATIFPKNILGMHSTMCISNTQISHYKLMLANIYPPLFFPKEHEDKIYSLKQFYVDLTMELGHLHLQSTKPDTLGVALKDSPMGLAAFILEKFNIWAKLEPKNETDGLIRKFSSVKLLDNIMLYWVTGSITTSIRMYAETYWKSSKGLDNVPIKVPSACAKFKNELIYFPDSLLKHKYFRLVQSNEFPVNGHFAAFEQPTILAKDIWEAVGKFDAIHKEQQDRSDL